MDDHDEMLVASLRSAAICNTPTPNDAAAALLTAATQTLLLAMPPALAIDAVHTTCLNLIDAYRGLLLARATAEAAGATIN